MRFHKPLVYQEESTVDSRELNVKQSEKTPPATDNGPRTTDAFNPKSKIENPKLLDGHYFLAADNRIHFEIPG